MSYLVKEFSDLVSAEISVIEPQGTVKEFQVMMHITKQNISFSQQLIFICTAIQKLLADTELQNAVVVSARCFLSDAANQQEQTANQITGLLDCPISYVKQPPLDGSKLALWLQLLTGVTVGNDGLSFCEHNGYKHYHIVNGQDQNTKVKDTSYQQTIQLLEVYEEQLKERNFTLERDCIRTWFFLRDIDENYQGFVEARKEIFQRNGLNNNTHYIASTGIEGGAVNPQIKVLMESYVISGLDKKQIQILYAKDHLSSTYEYGVTFERGVYVDYGDRRRVYLSGTASIDNKGQIMYPGDIEGQVRRMWDNVEALLKEAECTFDDMMQMIVYLRDMADYQYVKKMYDQKFPGIPQIIVLAPICRPGWLVEMECIAVKKAINSKYRDF